MAHSLISAPSSAIKQNYWQEIKNGFKEGAKPGFKALIKTIQALWQRFIGWIKFLPFNVKSFFSKKKESVSPILLIPTPSAATPNRAPSVVSTNSPLSLSQSLPSPNRAPSMSSSKLSIEMEKLGEEIDELVARLRQELETLSMTCEKKREKFNVVDQMILNACRSRILDFDELIEPKKDFIRELKELFSKGDLSNQFKRLEDVLNDQDTEVQNLVNRNEERINLYVNEAKETKDSVEKILKIEVNKSLEIMKKNSLGNKKALELFCTEVGKLINYNSNLYRSGMKSKKFFL